MISFVLGIIGIVGGAITGILNRKSKNKLIKILPTTIAIGFGIAAILLSCMKVVPTGHTGIVTTFGRVEDITLDAGVSFMAPWHSVVVMDNRTQKTTLELSCFSSDIQEVNVLYTINYQINKTNAQEIYRAIGKSYFEVIVQPKALEAIKSVFAGYTAEGLIGSRAKLSNEIQDILIADLTEYNIEIVSTSIEDIDFTDAFTNAVEAKQVAEQNKLKAKTEQEQANYEASAQAERNVIAAQAEADAAIIAAQADAEIAKISADSAEYQGQKDAAIMMNIGQMVQRFPELLDYYKVTNWNGSVPQTILGESSQYIIDLK